MNYKIYRGKKIHLEVKNKKHLKVFSHHVLKHLV